MDKINFTTNKRAYFYVSFLLAFSSFEFFFRDLNLLLAFYIICIVDNVFFFRKLKLSFAIILYIFIFFLFNLLHGFFLNHDILNNSIGFLITSFGLLAIANISYKNIVTVYCKVIYIIGLYSLIIYLICLSPSIYDFLFNHVASFDSLNVETAKIYGGGRNFIIYNFQIDFIYDNIGFRRNCGPFWEPGMFAVFLNICLFLNLFIRRKTIIHFENVIIILSLISTFSTGGFIALAFILIILSFNKGLSFSNLLIFLPVLIYIVFLLTDLDYIGGKTIDQLNDASIGSDRSRFGAFLTQILMIENSPLIGGELLKDYTEGNTLASGTLLPFVSYGIIGGLYYYFFLIKGTCQLSKHNKSNTLVGIELFLLILTLSFSQTILTNAIILVLIFSGLLFNASLCLKFR